MLQPLELISNDASKRGPLQYYIGLYTRVFRMFRKVLLTNDRAGERCLCDASDEEVNIIHVLINQLESLHYLRGYEVCQIIKPECSFQ